MYNFKETLTEQFLYTELVTKRKPIRTLANEIPTSIRTVLKYAKKSGVYEKLKALPRKEKQDRPDFKGKKFGKLKVLEKGGG